MACREALRPVTMLANRWIARTASREALWPLSMLANRWIARSWPVGRRCGLLPCWQIGGLPGHGLSGGAEACYHAGKSVDCPVMACREALRPVTMLANRSIARTAFREALSEAFSDFQGQIDAPLTAEA